jgi:hypothetical protein
VGEKGEDGVILELHARLFVATDVHMKLGWAEKLICHCWESEVNATS